MRKPDEWQIIDDYTTLIGNLDRCGCGQGVRMETSLIHIHTFVDIEPGRYEIICRCGIAMAADRRAILMAEWNKYQRGKRK